MACDMAFEVAVGIEGEGATEVAVEYGKLSRGPKPRCSNRAASPAALKSKVMVAGGEEKSGRGRAWEGLVAGR